MRLWIKLLAAIGLAAAVQLLIVGNGETLDEARFALQVYVANARGIPADAPELLEAADRLAQRQFDRTFGVGDVRATAARVAAAARPGSILTPLSAPSTVNWHARSCLHVHPDGAE
jgi:hypothetical protein